MAFNLFWIRSHGKGRRDEMFRELSTKHFRRGDAEQKAEMKGRGQKLTLQVFTFVFICITS